MQTPRDTANNTMKQATRGHDLDTLSRFFVETFPIMDEGEQRVAQTIYQCLAEGKPLSTVRLARELGRSTDQVKQVLDQWGGIFYDDDACIVGFWGIAVGETRHRMDMNGHTSYAWCAWDTLFIPELVGTTAQVTSACAGSDKTIRLAVSSDGVQADEPEIIVLFLLPEPEKVQASVTTSFCHYVYFFHSREAGEAWTAQHADTFLLALEEAFAVGKKVNASRYAEVL